MSARNLDLHPTMHNWFSSENGRRSDSTSIFVLIYMHFIDTFIPCGGVTVVFTFLYARRFDEFTLLNYGSRPWWIYQESQLRSSMRVSPKTHILINMSSPTHSIVGLMRHLQWSTMSSFIVIFSRTMLVGAENCGELCCMIIQILKRWDLPMSTLEVLVEQSSSLYQWQSWFSNGNSYNVFSSTAIYSSTRHLLQVELLEWLEVSHRETNKI